MVILKNTNCIKPSIAAFIIAAALALPAALPQTAAAQTAAPAAEVAATSTASAPAPPAPAATAQKDESLDDVLDRIETSDKYAAGKASPQIRSGGLAYAGQVIFSLFVVILLIIFTVYVLRQIYAKSMRLDLKGHHIRVVDVVQLGMNRSLFLVRVGSRLVLLGTADKGLVYLDDVTDAVDLESEDEGAAPAGGVVQEFGMTFRRQLNDALGIKKKGPSRPAGPLNSGLKDRLGKLEDDSEKGRGDGA